MIEYTETHEWIFLDGTIATVGLSEKAQKELGEIVFLDLPKIGIITQKEDPICVLESTKAAVDLYCPITGTVIAVNSLLQDCPEKINELPEREKWLYKIQTLPSDTKD